MKKEEGEVKVKKEVEVKQEMVIPAGFGLQFPGGKPPAQHAADVEDRRVAVSHNSNNNNKKKAPPPARRRAPLSEQEKTALLAQMTQDAQQVEQERGRRVQTAEEIEKKEEEERLGLTGETASFIRALNREKFEEGGKLADRMQTTRHTRMRTGPEDE